MAGRGPAPKDPRRRARTNADPIPTTVLRFEKAKQPSLPKLPDGEVWPDRTRVWWRTWGRSPQAEHFGETDWEFLLETARIHAAFWTSGSMAAATELRLRVAKFGATMEDRARLRMQFAQADEADAKRPAPAASREAYGDLRVVSGGAVAGT